MAKSLHWPPLAQRALLEWIDDQKGPQSALIQNYKQAIAELTKSLRTQFGDHKSFSKALSPSQVEQRIKYLWKDRLGTSQSSTLDTFYRDGTHTLDWNKLSRKPVARAYTKDEIASLSTATATDPVGASDGQEMTRAEKRRRTDNGSENRSDGKEEKQEARRRKSPSSDVERDSESQADRPHSGQTSRIVQPTTLENDATRTTSADSLAPTQQEESPTRAPEPSGQHRSNRRDSHGCTKFRHRLDIQVRDEAHNGESDGPRFAASRTESISRGAFPNPILVGAIESQMELLEYEIRMAIEFYSLRQGIPSNQPMIIDSRLRYPGECRSLFMHMLGLDSFQDGDWRSERLQAFQKAKIGLNDFLQSLVGCAVTAWCLRARLPPGLYFQELGGAIVEKVLKQAFTSEVEAEIRQRLWDEHLSRHVIRSVDSDAHHMADMMFAYIDMLIPREPSPRRREHQADVCRLMPEDEPPRFIEDLDRAELRRRLTRVFKLGLNCSIELSRRLHEDYRVSWPRFLTPYERIEDRRRQRAPAGAGGAADKETKERKVCLALTPLIERRTLAYVDGEWTELEVACKATVIPL
ncbi:hypothetical protein AYL99_05988 [Fonsecaea erecta]|uniref:Uncharacterized protein n=1 Tax=Fonsecaea erecta TaxID=1367422 RepID=A0A178ZME9_9EURO|nr:hypothetical protein AYL99_05988 [Fonsecaea erecta]OAP60984.1 hypothetical protein AYL99_05988 [Fonsecaea erecta]